MHRFAALVVLLLAPVSGLPAQEKTVQRQIAEAVSALPAPLRDSATVLGYRGDTLAVLRHGPGTMVCLADDPRDERWHVACYHRDLEPFMARGRALRAQDVIELAEINRIRRAEIEAGILALPDEPRALYSLFGTAESFDPITGEAEARGLLVVYLPYATEATTGLATEPSRKHPWLMFPGEPWAHLMIPRR